jgi:hypothetical protein
MLGTSVRLNGVTISTNNPEADITQAQYDALSTAQQNDGTTRFITTEDPDEWNALMHCIDLIGSESRLEPYGSTVIGAIVDLYSRINQISLLVDGANYSLQAVYNDEVSPSAEIAPISSYSTPEEQIDAIVDLLGDEQDLIATGNTTIIGAIADLNQRLNTFTLNWNAELETLSLTISQS